MNSRHPDPRLVCTGDAEQQFAECFAESAESWDDINLFHLNCANAAIVLHLAILQPFDLSCFRYANLLVLQGSLWLHTKMVPSEESTDLGVQSFWWG